MSRNNLTFLHDLIPSFDGIHIFTNTTDEVFYLFDSLEISVFLDGLENDKVYLISLALCNSAYKYEAGDPLISLSTPFLITKNSNPDTISSYLYSQAIKACITYQMEDDISINVRISYREINLNNLPLFKLKG
jgi:hypothetical protein